MCSNLELDCHTDIGEWLLKSDIGNDAVLCFYVDTTMHLDLTLFQLEFEIWITVSHIGGICDRRRYWGTPPKDMKFRYLVCNLLMGFKLYVGSCYLLLSWKLLLYILNLVFSSLHILLYHSAGLLGMLFVPSYCTLESTKIYDWYVSASHGPTTTNEWARVNEREKLSHHVAKKLLGQILVRSWNSRPEPSRCQCTIMVYEVLYSSMIDAVGLLGPLPRSDNPSQVV